jgi:hypothetical protein
MIEQLNSELIAHSQNIAGEQQGAKLAAGEKVIWDEQAHDHKMASALYAHERGMCDIAQVIAGHHGGMLDFSELQTKVGQYAAGTQEAQEKLAEFLQQVGTDGSGETSINCSCCSRVSPMPTASIPVHTSMTD